MTLSDSVLFVLLQEMFRNWSGFCWLLNSTKNLRKSRSRLAQVLICSDLHFFCSSRQVMADSLRCGCATKKTERAKSNLILKAYPTPPPCHTPSVEFVWKELKNSTGFGYLGSKLVLKMGSIDILVGLNSHWSSKLRSSFFMPLFKHYKSFYVPSRMFLKQSLGSSCLVGLR